MGLKRKNPGRVPRFYLRGPFIYLSTFWGTDQVRGFFYLELRFQVIDNVDVGWVRDANSLKWARQL